MHRGMVDKVDTIDAFTRKKIGSLVMGKTSWLLLLVDNDQKWH